MGAIIENSRVLVSGGAGFIGSNLIETLLGQNNEVCCLDNFSTGKRANIESFLGRKEFRLLEGDIRDFETCRQACDGVDYVLHQAALGSVPRSIDDPMTSTEVNISGFVNMLYAAAKAKVKRFVYAASSSTYGDSKDLPKVEERIGKPLSPYAITKYVNELYAENFSKLYGIDTVGLRYFNVFGRCQDPYGAYAAVIPKFALSLIRREAPVINGDGTYSRDFTHVSNVVRANQLAATATKPEALNTVYNIACGGRTSLNELFSMLRESFSEFAPDLAAIEPVYGPERLGDVPHSQASIAKAMRLLDYCPDTDVSSGIRQAAGWYWNNLGA